MTPDPVARDLMGFAQAVCLMRQANEFLGEQGGRWTEIYVQTRGYDPNSLTPITIAVAAELRRDPIAIGHSEAEPKRGVKLPIAHCYQIATSAPVQRAVTTVLARLKKEGFHPEGPN